MTNIFISLSVYFLIGTTLGKGFDILREQHLNLQESEARFRTLVSNVPGVIFRCNNDRDWTMHYINEEIEELTGYPAHEFIRNKVRTFAGVIHPDDRKMVNRLVQEGVVSKKSYLVRYRVIRADGNIRWVRENGQGVFDGTGELLYLDGVIMDITARKQAEEALRQSEEKFRTLVEKSHEGIMIIQKGIYAFANPRLCELLGMPAGSLEGKPFIGYVWPDDREMVLENYRKRLAGEPYKEAYDLRVVGAGGRLTWVFLSVSAIQWEGKTAMLGLMTDITARKQAEEEIKRIKVAVDATSDAVGLSTAEGQHFYQNQAFEDLFGYTLAEISSLHPLSSIYVDASEGRKVFDTIKAGKAWHGEMEMINKQGQRFPVLLRADAVKDENGNIIGLIGVHTDITERKQAEEALRRREEDFRALAENAPDVVARFDPELRYIYINPAIERITGIPREKFIGQTSEAKKMSAEQFKLRNETLLDVFQNGREQEMYYDHPTPTGRKYYHSRLVPEFAPDGSVETVLSIARDITAIKEMEAALYRERVKTQQMHRRALPDELPELPGLFLAASYRPAEKLQGDYYNVLRRQGQLLLYLVDVEAGRDDGVMQSLYVRKTIEDYLLAHGDDVPVSPALLLRYLKERYQQNREGALIPLCVFIAAFDDHPSSGQLRTLRYASTGFCTAPLLLRGSADPGGPSLKNLCLEMNEGTELVENSITIEPGSTFIFSTDGLFNQGPDSGSYELRLQEVLRNHAHLPPELINRAVETDFHQCFGDSPPHNDLAFIVAQVPRQEQRLSFKVESDFKHIEEAKEKVSTLLAQCLGHIPDLTDFHELLVNAIEHGNKRDGGKKATVEMALTDRYYKFIITDQGEGFNWRERINKELDWESESERGRGIIMTRMMTDYLGYNERGNRVAMIKLL